MKKDIYIIKNDINNKVYIGQAVNTKTRFQGHCKPSAIFDGDAVAVDIQKYGKQHFWYEILESQIENYNEKEITYIKLYDCKIPKGYNKNNGGEEPPVMKGSEHPSAILNDKQVNALTNDLLNTNISFNNLSEKYGFGSRTSISEFNLGKIYFRKDINYPIRKEIQVGKLSKTDVDEILERLKYSYDSYEEISSDYEVEVRTISRINKGMFHRKTNEKYPIRTWRNTSNKPNLTYDEVTQIINLLLHTKLSLREIGRQTNCEYRDVLNIKNGTSKIYNRKGLTYPLRLNN
jgi:group I intron endonuclease